MNICDSSTFRSCTSCQACAAICPHNAIVIQLNQDGFYRPVIDDSLCVNCGLCKSVCYKYDKDFLSSPAETLKDKKLFSAWCSDEKVLKASTSGGIADILAHHLLQKGYRVVGVVYNDNKNRAEHRVAEQPDQLIPFRGSKYIQSYTLGAFKEVIKNCREKKFAVFGTPCQIYALSRWADKLHLRDNFFFIDIYCHGCPSIHIWEKYLDEIIQKSGHSAFDSLSFRSKKKGWGTYCVEAIVNGESAYLSKRNDKFFELFFSDYVLNDSCYDCGFRSSLEYCDIRLGDFWGSKYIGNHRGVSAVTISSARGRGLFEEINNDIVSCECDLYEFLPSQSWGKEYHINKDDREAVLNTLNKEGATIDEAIGTLRSKQGFVKSVIRNIKLILSYLPKPITDSIKRLVYKIRK